MRETCTYGSMRGSRRKTAKSVLRVVEDRAGVPYGGVPLYSTSIDRVGDTGGGPRETRILQGFLRFQPFE